VSAADAWNNLAVSGITNRSYADTGLTNGTLYYYGVKAKDTSGNTSTQPTDTASATPTAANTGCNTCHGNPPSAAAVAGSHAKHGTTPADCGKCHGTAAATYTTTHADGSLQLGWRTATPSSVAIPVGALAITFTGTGTIYKDTTGGGGVDTFTGSDNIDNGTCYGMNGVAGCHGTTTPLWGGTVVCGTCHGDTARTNTGYTDTSTDVKGAPPSDLAFTTASAHVGRHTVHLNLSFSRTGNSCNMCHYNNNHGDGAGIAEVNFNNAGAGASWAAGTGTAPGTCSSLDAANGCHGNTTWSSVTTLTCQGCHSAIVTQNQHLKTVRGTATAGCTDCHPGGTAFPTKHSKNASVNVIEVPNLAIVGINQSSGGIHLGGNYTSSSFGTTFYTNSTASEAGMCWRCHDQNNNNTLNEATDTNDISEWGTNSDTNGTATNYNFGKLTNRNWVGASWTSAQTASPSFAYKTGTIAPTTTNKKAGSIHTANPSGPTANYDDTAVQIRCSYCHDVHNTKGPTGKPYLRGTWQGNPYREDGAPQTGFAYTGSNAYGAVPRGGTQYVQSGGYFIDQNSGNPTASWTADTFGGLCELCHGNGDGSFTAAEIGALDKFTVAGDWVSGYNGHANSVKGGAGPGTGAENSARNIYREARLRTVSTTVVPVSTTDGQNPQRPKQGYSHISGFYGFGFRNSSGRSGEGWDYPPLTTAEYAGDLYNWAATTDDTTNNANYHKFSCSKCHNPHASRLPRLLITNCLDTSKNTWDDGQSLLAAGRTNGNTNKIPTAAGTVGWENANVRFSNAGSAQNCHRRKDSGFGKTELSTGGWNNVSPW
jgi:hypothetical protein